MPASRRAGSTVASDPTRATTRPARPRASRTTPGRSRGRGGSAQDSASGTTTSAPSAFIRHQLAQPVKNDSSWMWPM